MVVKRCFEISKARIVAVSLLATSIQSMLEVGKNHETLRKATERTAFKLMFRGIAPSTLPWLMADTVDHMFRTDFMILMQYFCKKLEVPGDLAFHDVLIWLRDGNTEQCSEHSKTKLQVWLDKCAAVYLKVAPLENPIVRDALNTGLYLNHPHLQVVVFCCLVL